MHSQEHIIAQWTSIQAELATFSFAEIGSISQFSKEGNGMATVGPLAAAVAERFPSGGPFTTSQQYFAAVGEARYTSARKDASEFEEPDESDRFSVLGAFVFCDIVSSTGLFTDKEPSFHLNHMDMGTQNILVDDDFNFLAIIDWEFAQTAPVQVNHFPSTQLPANFLQYPLTFNLLPSALSSHFVFREHTRDTPGPRAPSFPQCFTADCRAEAIPAKVSGCRTELRTEREASASLHCRRTTEACFKNICNLGEAWGILGNF